MNSISLPALGRYRLIEQIGRGGTASVFKAYDPTKERYVALKILHPDLALDKQFSKRFRREAKLVMGLKHPNIVPVEDFGESDEYAYLVMPLLNLGSLADRLREGALSLEEGSRLMDQVAAGLQFAHDRGVVHRDVKPSNILLSDDGVALMSDFGLAHIEDVSVGLTGSALIGTPAYMSPEQAQGEPIDARSDQYSLGVILYQLSTGTLPFDAETPMAIVLKQINEPLPLVRARSPGVPDSVERVILKSTAKDPEYRFSSIAEMNRIFQASVAHELDPAIHPAPTIELPPISSINPGDQTTLVQPPERKQKLRVAGLIGLLLLLLLLACPLSSSLMDDLVADLTSPAEGGALVLSEMNDIQLTELAGTIEAMSTELAAAQNGTLPPESITTLVMKTLQADSDRANDLVAQDLTPTAELLGESWTEIPGPSPAASLTVPAAPSAMPTMAPTNTPMPMATVSPFPSSTAASTSTPVPPTPTSTPTRTPTQFSTATPNICSSIGLMSFSVSGQQVTWSLSNGGPTTVTITAIDLNWPSGNVGLIKIELGGDAIWDQEDWSPPTIISSGWKSGISRNIGSSQSKPLMFQFDAAASSSGYDLNVSFDNGCEVSANN